MARTEQILRWLYVGRLIVAAAIFVAAVALWTTPAAVPTHTLMATICLLAALAVTAAGLWWVEVAKRPATSPFLYVQVLFDVLLVTVIVHITEGPSGPYPPLYIMVITAGALLLPLPGGLVVGALSSVLYLGEVLFYEGPVGGADVLHIVLFGLVAVVTAAVGDRLRRTGTALGAVESELRQLRLDTADILAAMDTALVTVDGDGRLIYINSAGRTLLGVSAEVAEGTPMLDALERRASGLGVLVRRTAATRVPVNRFEIRTGRDGAYRYLGVRTTVLERQGLPSVTAVMQDITESKQLEALTRRADRLQAVAGLGASLAHEIKNPLASIRSAVEQLGGNRLSGPDRDMLHRLVVKETERLSRLLSDFMEFSRAEMGRWTDVDVLALTRDAIELAHRHPDRAANTRIELQASSASALVHGDQDLLHRAVFNLVLNAVQHAGASGMVTVELDRATGQLPSSVKLERPVRLRVRDTGPGVREEDIPRLFDPFFSRRSGGTGLGLALVHRAVEAHSGAILVDGGGGGGACFTIYLPAQADGEQSDGTEAS